MSGLQNRPIVHSIQGVEDVQGQGTGGWGNEYAKGQLVHMAQDAAVVCDDALERLVELLLAFLLIKLHEDLLQARDACQRPDSRRPAQRELRTKLNRYNRSLTCSRYERCARSSAGSRCFRMSISTSRWNCRCKQRG